MPNGKLGDHPLTDIVVHRMDVFGDEIDSLVRKIVNMPGYDGIKEQLVKILSDNDPTFGNKNCDYERGKSDIEKLVSKMEVD